MIPGDGIEFKSSDELVNSQDLLRFNTEYLNSLKPNGFPPHKLILKPILEDTMKMWNFDAIFVKKYLQMSKIVIGMFRQSMMAK